MPARIESGDIRLRVLHVVEAACAGVGRHSLDLAAGLARLGHEVHVLYSPMRIDRLFERGLDVARRTGVTAHPLPMRREIHPTDLLAIRATRRYIREHGPWDVVHGHSSKGGAVARAASVGTGVPVFYTPNAIGTMSPSFGPMARRAIGTIERVLARFTDTIIAVSREEQTHLRDDLDFDGDLVVRIPNGIPVPSLPSRAEARRRLGIPDDVPLIGFVGRLSEQKAPDVLIEAFAVVAHQNPAVELVIIGDGHLGPGLRLRTDGAGISSRVHWMSEQPGQESMPAFDVLAMPSRYEGLSYVLLEGLMAGLPIVTTLAASASDLVADGVNGFAVPVDDPLALAAAIVELLNDPAMRGRFGDASRRIADRYTVERMVAATADCYLARSGNGDIDSTVDRDP